MGIENLAHENILLRIEKTFIRNQQITDLSSGILPHFGRLGMTI